MGIKNQHMMTFRAKIAEIELAKKANMWWVYQTISVEDDLFIYFDNYHTSHFH